MKKMRILVAVVLLVLAVQAQAQTPLQEMVQTEQAFSRMAAEYDQSRQGLSQRQPSFIG